MNKIKNIKFILVCVFTSSFLVGCIEGFKSANAPNEVLSSTDVPNTQPPAVIPLKGAVNFQVRFGDRYYIANTLKEIFQSPTGDLPIDSAVNSILNAKIFNQGRDFGGSCTDYDPLSCRSLPTIDYQELSLFASDSPVKAAYIIGACTDLIETTGMTSLIENKASLVGKPNPTRQDLSELYKLFYPASTNEAALISIENLFNKVLQTSDRTNAIKLVTYTLCISPEWTIL